MALGFDISNRKIIDSIHSKDVYRFNLARHHALLSGDSAVIRRFYRQDAKTSGCRDIYQWEEISRSFFYNARPRNAFVYFGLIPWTVESIVRLVASNGFQVNTPLMRLEGQSDEAANEDRAEADQYVQDVCVKHDIQGKYERGVYLESGLGDFAYRISYDEALSDDPIIDIIEPQYLEVEYKRGLVQSITIKESTENILNDKFVKQNIEIREIYTRSPATPKYKFPHCKIKYKFFRDGTELTNRSKYYGMAKEEWGIENMEIELPFREFPVIFKKNNKKSELYGGERGVPDVQGFDTIEDALSESVSDLVDAIRKGAPKTFIHEDMLPTDLRGETLEYDTFSKEYVVTKAAGQDPEKMLTTTQAEVKWQGYVETAKYLISHAINMAGLSPTTLGVTGLESINSAAESQDAREKPSLRLREEKLKEWKVTLETLLNRYFQYVNFIKGNFAADKPVEDFSGMINVSFNEYISPATESVVALLGQGVAQQVYSVECAVEKRFMQEKIDYTLEDIVMEAARVRGLTPDQEMALLGLIPPPEAPKTEGDGGDEDSENDTLQEQS